MVIKVVSVVTGITVVIVTNSFWWELTGLALVIIPLVIPKRKRRFTRIK